MKAISLIAVFLMLCSINSNAQLTDSTAKFTFQNSSIPKGDKASANLFTGNAWAYFVARDSLANWAIIKVSFEPGAYSNWHIHPGKQVLVIIEGAGYLKEAGKPIQILRKGDLVTIEPGVKHWHGATPESGFIFMAVNPDTKNGLTNFLEKVTEEQYKTGKD